MPVTYSYIEPVPAMEQTANILYVVSLILLLIAIIYLAIEVLR